MPGSMPVYDPYFYGAVAGPAQAMPTPYTPAPLRPAKRQPVVRMQSEDQPLPEPTWKAAPVASRLTLPRPEELGVKAPSVAADWTTSLQRLESLGVVGYQMVEHPQGGWRFVCQLRTADPSRRQRIETGPVGTKAEAVQLALTAAEARVASKR